MQGNLLPIISHPNSKGIDVACFLRRRDFLINQFDHTCLVSDKKASVLKLVRTVDILTAYVLPGVVDRLRTSHTVFAFFTVKA
jgi:hypothetical protein